MHNVGRSCKRRGTQEQGPSAAADGPWPPWGKLEAAAFESRIDDPVKLKACRKRKCRFCDRKGPQPRGLLRLCALGNRCAGSRHPRPVRACGRERAPPKKRGVRLKRYTHKQVPLVVVRPQPSQVQAPRPPIGHTLLRCRHRVPGRAEEMRTGHVPTARARAGREKRVWEAVSTPQAEGAVSHPAHLWGRWWLLHGGIRMDGRSLQLQGRPPASVVPPL